MTRKRIIWMLLAFAAFSSMSLAQSTADSLLRLAETQYMTGSYLQAEVESRRLLEYAVLSDSVRILAEQWIGFSLVAQGRPALAKEHFLHILQIRPEHELDPVFTSPKILSVFNEARIFHRAKRLEEAQTATPIRAVEPRPTSYRAVLFPGWEQLYQGRSTEGTIFLAAGTAALGSGIVLEFLRASARKEYLAAVDPADIESKYNTYDRYYKAETYSFVAFAVIYLASEVDVFTHLPVPTLVSQGATLPSQLQFSFVIR